MSQSASAKKLAGRSGPFTVSTPSKGRPSGQIPDHGFKIMAPVGFDCTMPNTAAHYADPVGKLANGRGTAAIVTLPKP
jgi:hypothetical protein